MSGAVAGTAQWWEDDLAFLVVWAAVAGLFVVYRWRGGNRDLRAVAGALCVAGFMGGWYAGYQVQTSSMYVPLATST